MNEKIEISIVIATYNASETLDRCLHSIATQLNKNWELIIIDGGSKDKTIDIIKQYSQYVDYWISEPDNGIYDAWNKGIKTAKGDWIMFVGADDILTINATKLYANFLLNNKGQDFDLVSSKKKMVDVSGKDIRIIGSKWSWPQCLKGMMISHPGALHNKNFFSQYGLYNTTYKIAADYEFLLRPRNAIRTAFLNEVTLIVSEGGISDSFSGIKEHYRAVIETAGIPTYKALINDTIVSCKYFLKKRLRKIGINIYLNH